MQVGVAERPRLLTCGRLLGLAAAAASGESLAETQTSDPPLPPELVSPGRKDEEEAELIIVTGSRIPRPNLTAVSPVTSVPSAEIELQGTTRIEDLINSLPQTAADQGSHLSNTASGTATVNLRGIGPSRTLALINGRRMMPGDPTWPTPDLNTIPAALVERVEVLTGGASSVYGSDAVAGVVNFILETDLEGVRLYGQSSIYQHDNRNDSDLGQALERAGYPVPTGNVVDGRTLDFNIAGGSSFAGGRGHVTGYVGYRKLNPIIQDRRDYSACASQSQLNSEVLNCGGSLTSEKGTFFTNLDDALQVGPNRTFIPGFTRFNFGPYNYFQRPDERKIAGSFAKFEASDAFVPYVEAMYMDDRSIAQIAPSGDFLEKPTLNGHTINCDNPLLSEQQRALVCKTGNFVGETPIFNAAGDLVGVSGSPTPFVDPVTGATYFRAALFIGRRSFETASRQDDRRHKNLRLVGGVRGEFGRDWSYDAYYLFGRVKFSDTYLNDLSISRISRALDVIADPATGQPACRSALTGNDPNCVPWDIFALNSVSPEAAAYLPLTGTRKGTLKQQSVVVSITGQLGEYGIRSPWADEGLVINVGVEYRKESVDHRPDEIFASGDLAGQDQVSLPLKGSFDVREAFIEARLPIVTHRLITDLSIEGGFRRSGYDNGLNRFSSESYKLGLSFAPIPDIRLRASYNRAIRAPNIQELFSEQQLGLFVQNDPCAGPAPEATPVQCAAMGVTATQYGNILKSPIDRYNSLFGGNPNLGPETATTKTIGVVLQPRFLPGFSATVDWFDIDLKDAIFVVNGQVTVNNCQQTLDRRYCDRIHRDQFGSLWITREGYVDDLPINIASFKTSGVDIGVDYRRSIGLGSLEINVLGTWLDKFVEDNGGVAEPFDCVGLFGFICSFPRPIWRHKARLTWHLPNGLSLSGQWRHFAGVKIESSSDHPTLAFPFSPHDARIKAQNYFDLTALFPITNQYEFRIGVTNIFDREPPIIGATDFISVCALPYCNGNTYPQVYDALGRYFFAGVTVDF